MYDKVPTNMNFVEREVQVEKFWKENDIFGKSIKAREGAPVFTFYDGPPTANGKPHIGHIITRAVKDLIPRYKTMKGYKVLRKAGWDTHGLPVELEVEKALGLDGKPQIEKYGVEPFIAKCKESVWTYEKEWRSMSDRVGFWADMDHPYVTYHNEYIESEWWALKKIWDKGLLYKGHKVVPYCPRCGTALSSHEVAQGYKDVKETSAIAKFKVEGKDNEYFLAWTTTPWTLPSNIALTVNAKETYARVKYQDFIAIMAEALLNDVLGEGNYEVLETMKGQALEYMRYEPLFSFLENDPKAFIVTCDPYVTLTDGTGIVHSAGAFGEDDARVCQKYGVPFRQYVDSQGLMTEETGPFAGLFVKDADAKVIEQMEQDGSLFAAIPFEHNYPFCWRCDTPLIYYARSTWFIKMTALKDQLVANNRTINWYPDNIKEGRFGNFLENVIDWGLSRERYWGTPLPIWECECGHRHTIGSIAELKEMSPDCPENIELHKPFIDAVHIVCPECGKLMTRVSEVIDCWFDSGAMPFAQWHYPFENKEVFEENFPADFISEAVDQTRGWFYTLLAVSTLLFDCASFKNCIVLGHVQDKNGQKMSKHKGNVVDPWEALNKQGADAVRWYFYANSAPWLPSRYYDEAVSEMQRKFMGTLWNTYAFYILYANIDQFNPTNYQLEYDKLLPMDKWILSKLQTLNKFVDESLEGYKLTEPARAMAEFVDALSNWYVRRSRERFWAEGMEQDKINAYMTLYTVLETMCKLASPFTPFITEEIYGNLVKKADPTAPESVHLCDWPEYHADWVDADLESNMDFVLKVVVEGRAARNTANMKNRQPLAMMYVKSEKELPELYRNIITEELNVKGLTFTDNVEDFTAYTFKPQLRTLGKKYGKLVPAISTALKEVEGAEFMATLRAEGKATLTVEGEEVILEMDDVLVDTSEKGGFVSSGDNNLTVVLDTNMTPELVEEGFVREVVSKIQTMRKEANFNVTDRIRVFHSGNDKIAEILKNNDVSVDVLAEEVVAKEGGELSKEWNINGEVVTLGVSRV
ncbi:isoleucine--tRNA ligase [Anaerotignum propionicum]|jgi:isoleucyl-tRNA synthetase|uniref:isoleucine--tRNA ligase n=1 Tax=Anaerotignum propionicum TaxID=28446 RepID=UPI00289C0967|nr:isoleucine--tRNA ligase [Anaerotignum propionicum]